MERTLWKDTVNGRLVEIMQRVEEVQWAGGEPFTVNGLKFCRIDGIQVEYHAVREALINARLHSVVELLDIPAASVRD